ncbi:MAG: SOS response-associated peptidase [Sandaracinobacteroides sp.]
MLQPTMCTLYRLASNSAEIARLFEAEGRASWEPPAAFYPDRIAPVVGHSADGRVLADARWGVPPPAAGGRPVVNIRNLESPFWRAALAKPALRCLVPADAFCEWTDTPDAETGRKRQFFFGLASGAPFAFAGLIRPGADGEVPRFAFLTCEPNAVVAPVHAKAMPVILPPADWAAWLEGAPARAFQRPLAAAELLIVG